MTFRHICGILLIFGLGFMTFIALSGLGYAMAITLTLMSWWQIVVGTIFGTIMVVVHLWCQMTKDGE